MKIVDLDLSPDWWEGEPADKVGDPYAGIPDRIRLLLHLEGGGGGGGW
ncbi:MAG: hypothetical protein DDT21_02543 [Syntrophomonadaceae bacterium]|nr:hypothetical protein [Bacillota bacterium]